MLVAWFRKAYPSTVCYRRLSNREMQWARIHDSGRKTNDEAFQDSDFQTRSRFNELITVNASTNATTVPTVIYDGGTELRCNEKGDWSFETVSSICIFSISLILKKISNDLRWNRIFCSSKISTRQQWIWAEMWKPCAIGQVIIFLFFCLFKIKTIAECKRCVVKEMPCPPGNEFEIRIIVSSFHTLFRYSKWR